MCLNNPHKIKNAFTKKRKIILHLKKKHLSTNLQKVYGNLVKLFQEKSTK